MQAVKRSIKRVVPGPVKAVQRWRRDHMGLDIHEVLTATQLEHVARYQFANDLLPEQGAVLDAACGSGFGSMLFTRAARYVGIDLDPRAVTAARQRFPTADFREGNVYRLAGLAVKEGAFDMIASFETLEHIGEPWGALDEFQKALKPGGLVVGSVPVNHPEEVFHVRKYGGGEIVSLVEGAGLSEVRFFDQRGVQFDALDREGAQRVETGTLVFVGACNDR